MNRTLRKQVRQRADNYCEYCRLHQQFDVLPHHVDHIIARKHQGDEALDNLSLACTSCSLAKGSNIGGRDLRTMQFTRLFHPRMDSWHEHSRWRGPTLVGKTSIGRVTVLVLRMNQTDRVALRKLLIKHDQFPPGND